MAQRGCAADRDGQAMVVVEIWVAMIRICVWLRVCRFSESAGEILELLYYICKFFYFSLECQMKPTVVSDPWNWDSNPGRYSAKNTFTNTDKPNVNSNWIGKNKRPAHFVYSLGCKSFISNIVIRNACNGVHKNR